MVGNSACFKEIEVFPLMPERRNARRAFRDVSASSRRIVELGDVSRQAKALRHAGRFAAKRAIERTIAAT